MEVTAYHLSYDNIHDFKATAIHVESEIRRHGLRDNSFDAVPGMNGRKHHDMWVSMKTVSHFNLGIALESMLKLLLFLNKIPMPRHHFLEATRCRSRRSIRSSLSLRIRQAKVFFLRDTN